MKRTRKLILATNQETGESPRREGLQAMWRDRWVQLGDSGRVNDIQQHGGPPPLLCPLVRPAPPRHGVRRFLAGALASPAGPWARRIRKARECRPSRS